jgi:hypothetical protein
VIRTSRKRLRKKTLQDPRDREEDQEKLRLSTMILFPTLIIMMMTPPHRVTLTNHHSPIILLDRMPSINE